MSDSTALQQILDTMDDKAAIDSLGFARSELRTIDEAKHQAGAILVQYTGQQGSVRYQQADFPVDRMASSHSRSVGPGFLVPLVGKGDVNANPTYVRTNRIAQGIDDQYDIFFKANSGAPLTWANSSAVEVAALSYSVKVPNGVTHLLIAEAIFEVHAANSSTAIRAMMRIGDGNVTEGTPGVDNLTANVGPTFTTGNSDQWHTVHVRHVRTILGDATTAVSGVKCNPRVLRETSTSGSPNYPGQPISTLVVGDTFRLSAATNLRTNPNTGADIITTPGTGATGTIVGGPATGNGYVWYQCSIGVNTGWMIKDSLTKTTAPASDPAVGITNSLRSGWLQVTRVPI